jgi:translation elongation factor P/translation initiation factor 5A
MYTTSDLKRGLILSLDDMPHQVESVQSSSPTARGANTIHKVRMRNLKTRQKVERSFRGGDTFDAPDVEERPIQLLYEEPDSIHFMDGETFEQFQFHVTRWNGRANFWSRVSKACGCFIIMKHLWRSSYRVLLFWKLLRPRRV